jgi:7-cyano-7-deazaguanine synthase
MKKVLVITSGGLDSTVLLYAHIANGDNVRALGVDYGQRHKVELEYALKTANALKIPFMVARMDSLSELLPGSSQTSNHVAVPEGHYAAENMKATVVPNRNMILLAVAMGHALAHNCEAVSYAAHAGDHAIYPDCRPEFADAMDAAARLCDWKPMRLLRPFIHLTKSEIVAKGASLKVDFSQTYSCYAGKPGIHCGRCGTCVERAESFCEAGIKDPTKYESPEFFRTVKAPLVTEPSRQTQRLD